MSEGRTAAEKTRVGFLVVSRRRGGFDPDWGERMAEAARRTASAGGLDVVAPSVLATDEPSMRAAVDELRAAGCEILLVLQPTMGDGRLAPTLIQRWADPVVLWATSERQDSDRVSACTLVGTHAFASLLRQRRHPFEIVNGPPESPDTAAQLDRAVRVTRTLARLKRGRVGLVGTHAPGFLNMEADADGLANQVGPTMHHFGVQELIDATWAVDEEAVRADREAIDALGLGRDDEIPEAALAHTSRYFHAIPALYRDAALDAIAIRGWPELPNVVGTWPYLAYSRLGDLGYPIAMEGDLDGAATLLIGKWMGYGVGYLSDWLEHDERRIMLWHQGEAPLGWCEPGAALARHFNNDKPVVVNTRLAANRPVTLARLWHCDGRFRLAAADARTEAPPRVVRGTCGAVAFEDGRSVPDWFEQLCHEGMPHHVALFDGHRAAELHRLAKRLGLERVAME